MDQDDVSKKQKPSSRDAVGASSSSCYNIDITERLETNKQQNLVFVDTSINTLNREECEAASDREMFSMSAPRTSVHRHWPGLHPPPSSESFAKSAAVKSVPIAYPQSNHNDEREADGLVEVRVVRNGTITTEAVDPYRLARLYAQRQAALERVRGKYTSLEVPEWVRLHPRLGTYLAESLGTFACTLTISLAAASNKSIFSMSDDSSIMCLPTGFIFMSMISAFSYISGGHFNPALSIAIALVQKLKLAHCVGYIICQVAAAFGAGVVAMLIQGNMDIYVPKVIESLVLKGFLLEMTYTFIIVFVMLHTGYGQRPGQPLAGLATGMVMLASVAAMGSISNGVFNPAVATGLQVATCLAGRCDSLGSFWVHWVAPVSGAALAALIFSQMRQPTEDDEDFGS
ncbi:unnamed protein product [Phytomonas sp. EM1]|nr:unnamed protein product [Phytomonas sp. EM1]|eukprot:CCW60403.1 unnamed protein product [Phytomonas sp. isolate EM1]